MVTVDDAKIIALPKILDERGNLSFIQNNDHFPFEMKRVYWVYDVPGGELRGGHAFREQQELIIALSGSLDIIVSDGSNEKIFSLNRSYSGLYIPALLWRSMANFSTNAVVLIVSNSFYSEDDYIRDFNEYKKVKNV